MRAFTVHRPWAWAIAYAGKDVENRDWDHRLPPGTPIVIHAGKKWDADGAAWIAEKFNTVVPPEPDQPSGVIATATIGKCLPLSQTFSPWATGELCWPLAEVRALAKPIPFRGQQKIFNIPDSVVTPDTLRSLVIPKIEPGDYVQFDDAGYDGGIRTGVVIGKGNQFLSMSQYWIVDPDDGGNPRFLLPIQLIQI
jgi:hypothetical protein